MSAARDAAAALLQALVGLVKAQALYPPGHAAEARARAALVEAVGRVAAEEPVLIGRRDGHLAVGEVAFLDPTGGAAEVDAWLEAREVEGVTLHPGVEGEELVRFCRWLRAETADPWQGSGVELTRLARGREAWQRGLKSYRKAFGAVRDAYDEVAAGRCPDPDSGRECVAEFASLLQDSPEVVQGLALIKDYDQYTYHHSVNVCLLSLRVGHQWRLGAEELDLLGTGGLFHDIGKTRTPAEVVRKAGPLTRQEWAAMQHHPVAGRELAEQMGLARTSTLLVYEHHMHHDGGGYPQRPAGYRVHPLSAVVAAVDTFDAMTSHRSYNRPLSQQGAIQQLAQLRGKILEPAAVEMLLAALGPVPLGAVVRLPGGELGVVVEVSTRDAGVKVRVVRTAEGRDLGPAGGPVVALGDPGGLHPVDPLAHRVNPVEVLQQGA